MQINPIIFSATDLSLVFVCKYFKLLLLPSLFGWLFVGRDGIS